MTPLNRPSATFSPQAGRRISHEIPRPAKRGEGAAKRRVRGLMHLLQASEERRRWLETDQPLGVQLMAGRVEEDERRNADDLVLLRQLLYDRIFIVRQIGLDRHEAIQLRSDGAVAERLLVELF